jgi:hypothetical protein
MTVSFGRSDDPGEGWRYSIVPEPTSGVIIRKNSKNRYLINQSIMYIQIIPIIYLFFPNSY